MVWEEGVVWEDGILRFQVLDAAFRIYVSGIGCRVKGLGSRYWMLQKGGIISGRWGLSCMGSVLHHGACPCIYVSAFYLLGVLCTAGADIHP